MGERKTLTIKLPKGGVEAALSAPEESPDDSPAPSRLGPKACLVVTGGPNVGRRIDLVGRTELGAGDTVEVARGPTAKPVAMLTHEDDTVEVRSLVDPPQLIVNDLPVARVVLRHGDRVRLGAQELTVLIGEDLEAAYHEELYKHVTHDHLTAAYNTRYLMDNLESLTSRSRRWDAALSLVVVRLGNLAVYRRRHGEAAAVEQLRDLADTLIALTRSDDIVGRVTDEELAVILFRTPRGNAEQFADRVRALEVDPELELVVGVATMDVSISSGEILLQEARAQVNPWPVKK